MEKDTDTGWVSQNPLLDHHFPHSNSPKFGGHMFRAMWRPGATCRCDFRTAFCWLMLWRSCRSGMHLGVQNGDPFHSWDLWTGWWFEKRLLFFHSVGNVIIPTDEVHHFSEGFAATTNQWMKWSHGTTGPRKMGLESGHPVEKTLEIRFHNWMLYQGWFRKWWIYGLYLVKSP